MLVMITSLTERGERVVVHEAMQQAGGRARSYYDAPTDLVVGDQLQVHPGHCCSAANLHDTVFAVRDGIVADDLDHARLRFL